MKKRNIQDPIVSDLIQKMVFVAGPRQVGKTTLARQVSEKFSSSLYLNYDRREDRKKMREAAWPSTPTLVILDELHKYKKWKSWIKGEYDHHKDTHQFLITGSARLDVYRRGSDSLQGRYHHYRLHPFTLCDLENRVSDIKPMSELNIPETKNISGYKKTLDDIIAYSGFPEPLLAQDKRTHRRWQKERAERFFREDIRDLNNVKDLSGMQTLIDILPDYAGNLLSLENLRQDLEVSHKAISHWIDTLELLYFCFRIRPFVYRKIRALKKQPKIYYWDTSTIENKGAKYENIIALHLLKTCHYLEDTQGYKAELFFLRDVDKREVDFLITVDRKPWMAVEVKSSSENLSPHLRYFKDKLNIPYSYQLTFEGTQDVMKDGIRILPAAKFLLGLV